MDAEVLSAELREAMAGLDRAVDSLACAGLDPSGADEASAMVRGVERLKRRLDAVAVGLAGAIDSSKVFAVDGHRSARAHLAHVGRLAEPEAGRRVRDARALRALPAVAAAFAAGRIGTCQVTRIARLHSNPRVRVQVVALDQDLAVIASQLSHRDLDRKLTEWERLADQDGTGGERAHADRSASVTADYDGGWSVRARLGSVEGAQFKSIFDRLCTAEFEADRAEAAQRLGDRATVADHRRSDAQRRADALLRMALRAADAEAAAPGGSGVETVVVMDWATYRRELQRLDGDEPLCRRPPSLNLAPDRAGTAGRCSTLDGHAVNAASATRASLTGTVRRAVIGAAGVTIDLGRSQRLFRGPARRAAQLAGATCAAPGCTVAVSHCQIDHLVSWATGGPTDQANAAPLCGSHNRLKEHGYTLSRAPDGTYRLLRPDGGRVGGG